MDLPLVIYSKQKRPALKAEGINALIDAAESEEEKYLYVLLAATGMRISEALALEVRHFINGGLTIVVEQQVDKDHPRIVNYLKTDASYRQIDLHPAVADYLRKFVVGKSGLILRTENDTPYLYGNLAEDWLDQRLAKLGLYGQEWAGTASSGSATLGSVPQPRDAKKTCGSFGSPTSRRRWVNCTRHLKRTYRLGSTKPSVWAMASFCPRKLFQMFQEKDSLWLAGKLQQQVY